MNSFRITEANQAAATASNLGRGVGGSADPTFEPRSVRLASVELSEMLWIARGRRSRLQSPRDGPAEVRVGNLPLFERGHTTHLLFRGSL